MKNNLTYLYHIRDAIKAIENFLQRIDQKVFFSDLMVQSAVIRQIEVIGEAAKNVSRDLRAKYPNVPWKEITAMRNILIHEYFQVD